MCSCLIYNSFSYMTDDAGTRQYECNPGAKLWHPRHPPAFLAQFWNPRSGFGDRFHFCQTKKKLLEMVQLSFLFRTFPIIFVCFDITKTEMAAKTAPRVPKLGQKGGRVPQLSARVTLVLSGAGVVCHIQQVISINYNFLVLKIYWIRFEQFLTKSKVSSIPRTSKS